MLELTEAAKILVRISSTWNNCWSTKVVHETIYLVIFIRGKINKFEYEYNIN